MNKPLFFFLAIAFSVPAWLSSAIAREKPYEGKCLYINKEKEEQNFKSCQVNFQQKKLVINFKQEKYQDNNQTIAGQSIEEIASGKYAEKLLSDSSSIVSQTLLGPINLVGKILVPDRDYQQYIIKYKDTAGEETATILNVNRSDAPEFQQELTISTGRLINFQPGQTNNVIDIGPELK